MVRHVLPLMNQAFRAAGSLRIPVVDLRHGHAAGAAAIREACEGTGFFVVQGHSIPDATQRDVWNAAWNLFDTVNTPGADSLRSSISLPHAAYPYGYAPMESERLAASLGDETPPDLKETFSIGPLSPPAFVPEDPIAKFAFSDNLWPDLPHFRESVSRYYEAANDFSNELLDLFRVALDLPEDFFTSKVQHHMSALRLNNYPSTTYPPPSGALRAGEHSDYGCLTVLMPHRSDYCGDSEESTAAGLQVYTGGEWRDIEAPPNTLIVNIGDLMARWTNDRWRSTLHRVVVPPPRDELDTKVPRRMSLAFFHQPNCDAHIECIPSCLQEGETALHEPTTAGGHIKGKFEAAGFHLD